MPVTQNETTIVHYLHVPREENCSKKLFLQGRLKNGETFKVLVDLSTQAWDKDGKLDEVYSNILHSTLKGTATQFTSPSIPNRNYAIYEDVEKYMPNKVIELACFYQYDEIPGVVY